MGTLTFEYIKNEISKSDVIFKRGENIYSLGNYSLIEENPEEKSYKYSFDGNYGDYTVSVSLKNGSIVSECSCPFPHDGCKHVVAACLDIMVRKKRAAKEQSAEVLQEYMTPEEVRETAIKGRMERARKEEFQLIRGDQFLGPHVVKNSRNREYTVTIYDPSEHSGHCTCSDYATNHLETCKHLLFVYNRFEKDKNFRTEAENEVFPFIHFTWNSRLQKPVYHHGRIEDPELSTALANLFNEKGVYTRESFNQLYQFYLENSDNDFFRFDPCLLDKIEPAPDTRADQMQPELDDETPHYLNPEILNQEDGPEIDLEAEEFGDDVGDEPVAATAAEEKPFEPEQLETVLNQGLSFLNGLSQMATGKAIVGENSDKAVEINKETGEVVLRFKLPGF